MPVIKTAAISVCFGGVGGACLVKAPDWATRLLQKAARSIASRRDTGTAEEADVHLNSSDPPAPIGIDETAWRDGLARFSKLQKKIFSADLKIEQVPMLLVIMHCDSPVWTVERSTESWQKIVGVDLSTPGRLFLENLQPVAVSEDCPELLCGLFGNFVRDGKPFALRAVSARPLRKAFNCHCCPADSPFDKEVQSIVPGVNDDLPESSAKKINRPALSRLYLVVLDEIHSHHHGSAGSSLSNGSYVFARVQKSMSQNNKCASKSAGDELGRPSREAGHEPLCFDSLCSQDSLMSGSGSDSTEGSAEASSKRRLNKGLSQEALNKLRAGTGSSPSSPFKDVRLMQLIGKGAFAKVYLGLWIAQPVAVKVLPWTRNPTRSVGRPVFEGALASELSHPNLVQTFQHSTHVLQGNEHIRIDASSMEEAMQRTEWDEFETWIVQEWCDMGTLMKYCNQTPMPSTGGLEQAASICIDVGLALAYMHGRQIIHGDLTSNNVLLTSRIYAKKGFICKVSDFGLSRILEDDNENITTDQLGTVTHMPPELLRLGQSKLSVSADVYAFGVLMWEVYMRKVPWAGLTKAQVIIQVAMGNQLQIADNVPPAYRAAFQRCIAAADERPTAEEVILIIQEILEAESNNQGKDILEPTLQPVPEATMQEPTKHNPMSTK